MSSQFTIEILEQGWLDLEDSEHDICSHGKIKLVIGGQVIISGEESYGISESALALLRTLTSDHTGIKPLAERLIFHGCSTLLMVSCPIGINWDVVHTQESILLENVVRFDTTNENQGIRFSGLTAKLTAEEYRKQVVNFALKAKQLFEASPRQFYDEFDRKQFAAFWIEYDSLLEQYLA